ncbi:MAG: TSCPD domain-containing protein [Candidatus Heimdallarchaeota archaeon]
MVRKFNYIYTPDENEDTCKTSFDFELVEEDDGEISISNLTIDGEKGCIGQNSIIPILVKNRKVVNISIDELKEAGCRRAVSCAQQLAKAIQNIIHEHS